MSGTQQEGPGQLAAAVQEGRPAEQQQQQQAQEQRQEGAAEEGGGVDYISPAQVGTRWATMDGRAALAPSAAAPPH